MNLIKNNEVLNPLYNKMKIFYEDNYLEITHYNKILSINNEEILLKKISIIGKELKVIYIDKYLIRVNGNINSVRRIRDETKL